MVMPTSGGRHWAFLYPMRVRSLHHHLLTRIRLNADANPLDGSCEFMGPVFSIACPDLPRRVSALDSIRDAS